MFQNDRPGALVPVNGTDPVLGDWTHHAFVPHPLPGETPPLEPATYLAVANARAALAALDSTARQLPNPTLLRLPTLRREAQSTSALEGTYAPLTEVLTADEDDPATAELVEVLNYVRMANLGFSRIAIGQSLSLPLLSELQGILMRGTPLHEVSGRVRDGQVVIGRRPEADPFGFPVHAARFVPAPPGYALETGVRDLIDWMRADHSSKIDPVVAAAMSHYQFETLHPFRDGNGRLGRFLIVLHLQSTGVLSEPTLTVSPWFEARRSDYYDRLLAVSTHADWDGFIRFFSQGLQSAADQTHHQMRALVAVQAELKDRVRSSNLRADSAHALVDLAVANPSFTVRKVESDLNLSYGRANKLVGQLVELGILQAVDPNAYNRRFYSPRVLTVLTQDAM
jgi:Fic family protein